MTYRIFLFILASLAAAPAQADPSIPSSAEKRFIGEDYNRLDIYRPRSIHVADGNDKTIELTAPSSLTADGYQFILPDGEGTANQCLATDGSGSTSWVDAVLQNTDWIDFADQGSNPSDPSSGLRLFARDDNGVHRLVSLDQNGDETEVSGESYFVAKNTSGSSITRGEVVYVTGQDSGVPTVSLARADQSSTMPVLGIPIETIPNNGFGRVFLNGVIDGLNTTSFSPGDDLYLSATTAGGLVSSKPAHPNYQQRLGKVVTSDGSDGTIAVAIRGIEGDELGTAQNTYSVGDDTAGTKTVEFKNGNTLSLEATPTGDRTVTVPDATTALVGTDTTDDLSGKTFTDEVTLEEQGSTPSTPNSGDVALYPKSDGNLYKLDSAGTESKIGSGSGSGVNYIPDPNSKGSCWTDSGSGTTSTTTDNTSEIARPGAHDTALKVSLAAGTGDYTSCCFRMGGDHQDHLQAIAYYRPDGSNYSDDDVRIELYENDASNCSGTYTELGLDTDDSGDSTLKDYHGDWPGGFDSTDSDWYELRIVNNGGTDGWVSFNDVTVGPGAVLQQVARGESVSFTPSFTNDDDISFSVNSAKYARDAEDLKARISVDAGGDGTNSSKLLLTLPNSLSHTNDSAQDVVGYWHAIEENGSSDIPRDGIVRADESDATRVEFLGSNPDGNESTLSGDDFGTSSGRFRRIFVVLDVSISKWEGSTHVNSQAVDPTYVSHDGSNIVYGQDGAEIPTSTPSGSNETYDITSAFSNIQASDKFVIETQRAGDGPWVELPSGDIDALHWDGTNHIGAGLDYKTSTFRIIRGKYKNGTSNAWSNVSSGSRWRVRRIRGANAWYEGATADKKGLVNQSDWIDVSSEFSSTPSGWSVNDAKAQVRKDGSGQWSVYLILDAGLDNTSNPSVTFDGVSPSFGDQALASDAGNTDEASTARIRSNQVIQMLSTNVAREFRASGRFLVDSKPTWVP